MYVWAAVAGDVLSTLFGTMWSCQLPKLDRRPLFLESSLLVAGEKTISLGISALQ
jgi:hypothetical protein